MIAPQRHIEKADRALASGRYLLIGGFNEQAGRDAYLAAFHAALAFIVVRIGKEPRTHSGTEASSAPCADRATTSQSLRCVLGNAYELKSLADDEGGEPLSHEDADAALKMAAEMVEMIAGRLGLAR